MASLLTKIKLPATHLGKCFHTHSSVRFAKKLPDSWDLATGLERWQAVQYAKGNKDPFFMKPIKRGPGTKDCPIVVPSVYSWRLVACHCHEDDCHLVPFMLHEGYPRRCNCNYWFVLERHPYPPLYEDC